MGETEFKEGYEYDMDVEPTVEDIVEAEAAIQEEEEE